MKLQRSKQNTPYNGTLLILFSNPKFLADIRIEYGGLYNETKAARLFARTLSADFTSIGIIFPSLFCITKSSSALPGELQ